jgi:hypothetical protein
MTSLKTHVVNASPRAVILVVVVVDALLFGIGVALTYNQVIGEGGNAFALTAAGSLTFGGFYFATQDMRHPLPRHSSSSTSC